MPLLQPNYLDLSPEDLGKLNPKDMDVIISKVAEMILAEFKALDCTVCEKHFGYQHRGNHRIILCSSECLALAKKKLYSLTGTGGSPFTGRSPQSDQGLPLTPESPGFPALEDSKKLEEVLHHVSGTKSTVGITTKAVGGNTGGRVNEAVLTKPPSTAQAAAPVNTGKSGLPERKVSVPPLSDSNKPSEAPAPAPLRQAYQPKSLSAQGRTETRTSAQPGSPTRPSPFQKSEEKENAAPTRVSPPPLTQPKQAAVRVPTISKSSSERKEAEPEVTEKKTPAPATAAKEKESVDVTAVKPRLTRPKPMKVWTIKDTKRSPNLKPGARCYVNYVWGPAKLTLIAAADWEKLEEMRKDIRTYCEKAEKLSNTPGPNEVLFAFYGDSFYRCVVTDVRKDAQEVDVIFPDDGDRSTVKFSDCRPPSDEIMIKHPIYGAMFECSTSQPIPDDMPFDSDALSNEVVFESESEMHNGWRGKLFICKGKDKYCWNEKLEEGVKAKGTCKQAVEATADSNAQPEDPAIIVRGKVSPPPSKHSIRTMPLSAGLKNGAKVVINYCWSPKTLAVGAADDASNISELQQLIKKQVTTAQPPQENPALSDVVLCPYDGEYYRGVVEELLADGGIRVRFIDYGDEATVSRKDIRLINDAIAAHPLYGIVIMIDDIPDEKLDQIPQAIPALKPAIIEQQPCKIQLKEEVQHGVWKGELNIPSGEAWSSVVLSSIV